MDPASIFAIVGATAAVVSAFRDGLDMFKSWRKKRKEARRAQVAQVEQSLEHNPPEVERDYKQYVSQLGPRFERGDDISNKSLARIIEKFTRTLTITLKELSESNCEHMFEVSESARHDSLDVMLQLCQRLHTSAPIINMKKAETRDPGKKAESNCSIHTGESTLPHPYHVQVTTYTGDNLRDVLDQIPKAKPNITLSGPSMVVSHTIGNPPVLIAQTAYTQGSCQCSHSTTTSDYTSAHDGHEIQGTSSPLKNRLDEMDRIFGSSIRSSIAAQPASTGPTRYPPPPAQSLVSNQSAKAPLDPQSQQWHSWSPAPLILSSTPPASTRAAPLSLASDLVYSQAKTKSLQQKLNTLTQTMISTNLTSTHTPFFSSPPSMYSGRPPSPVRTPVHLPQLHLPPVNDRGDQILQWAESVQTVSLASGPGSVSGASDTALLVFPGVRRYTGSVRMSGGLPTPPP